MDRLASEKKKEQFRDNLINNISHGSPSAEFMWPLDITVETHGSFGYIMDLVPSNYVELSKLLIQRKFPIQEVMRNCEWTAQPPSCLST